MNDIDSKMEHSQNVVLKLGTLEKAPYQRALEMSRVATYVKEFNPSAIGQPLISLRDSLYWIVDGQHRIAALLECGLEEWLCEVVTGLTYQEEAELFVRRNTFRSPTSLHRFHSEVAAGMEPAKSVQDIVESVGLHIARPGGGSGLRCVSALKRVYAYSPRILHDALQTIATAWPNNRDALEAHMVKGAGEFFRMYGDKVDMANLAWRLQRYNGGPRVLLATAAGHPDHKRMDRSVAAIWRGVYNSGKRSGQLS